MSDFINSNKTLSSFESGSGSGWVILSPIEAGIKKKIESIGTPLRDWDINIYRGILTGFNEAFIIDAKIKDELIKASPKNAEIIRPILRGRDIKKYGFDFADLWLISTFPFLKTDIEKYPAVKEHLLNFSFDRLKQTGDSGARKKTGNKWFETQDSISYCNEFHKDKIVWGEISDKPNFALDRKGKYFINNKCYLLTGPQLEYLICYLNSHLAEYLFSKIATTTGQGTLQWSKFTIEQLLIPTITEAQENEFRILLSALQENKITEMKINSYINELCGLTVEEIAFLDNFSN